jgi:aspartate aminotransferase-like enzyme
MYITLEKLRELRVPLARPSSATKSDGALSFLPGPVDIHPDVVAALGSPPISHRDLAFMSEVEGLKRTLCEIVRATHVEVLLGSGTLANDVVAGQLSLLMGHGVVMSNGEFGDRLIDHASRAGLVFATERLEWGAPFDAAAIDHVLARHPDAEWVWMVNLETSTGVANDLQHLVARAGERSARVAADCVSAIGTVDVDATGVYLMTGVSGKGIGSFPGLSMVFHGGALRRHTRIPRYLDLSLYADAGSVPFTQSSNLVRALGVASRRTMLRGGLADLQRLGSWLRGELRDRGLTLVAAEHVSTPIVTIALGPSHSSVEIGEALQERGFALSFRSTYLRTRNWIQIAVLGDCSRKKLRALLAAWDDVVQRSNT